MKEFDPICKELKDIVLSWEPILSGLSDNKIPQKLNSQNRNIKQILGHIIDSASNNTHRIVHLQYSDLS